MCVFTLYIVQNFIANVNYLHLIHFFPFSRVLFSGTLLKCSKTLLGSDFCCIHYCGNSVVIENHEFYNYFRLGVNLLIYFAVLGFVYSAFNTEGWYLSHR